MGFAYISERTCIGRSLEDLRRQEGEGATAALHCGAWSVEIRQAEVCDLHERQRRVLQSANNKGALIDNKYDRL